MSDREIPSPGALVRDAYRKVEAERAALFRIAAIPAAMQFLIITLLHPQDPAEPSTFIASILNLIPATMFDVAWLRRLLGADAGDPLLPYRWGRRQTGYLVRFALLILLLAFPFMSIAIMLGQILGNAVAILMVAGAIGSLYVFLRLSMILVGQALDRSCDPRTSWSATQAGAFRLFWGAAFASLPVLLIGMTLIAIADTSGLALRFPLLTTLAVVVLGLVLRALFLAVVARVYGICMTGIGRMGR
ncbi:MAG: hypothetical protein ACKVOI_17580 [Dongiaceae bacterium]